MRFIEFLCTFIIIYCINDFISARKNKKTTTTMEPPTTKARKSDVIIKPLKKVMKKIIKTFIDLYPDLPPFNWFYHDIVKFYNLTR